MRWALGPSGARWRSRANAVVSALVARGVDPEAVEAVSWEDQVAGVAGWAPGGYESRRAEVSFVLDGVRLPPCPGYYRGVSEAERVWPHGGAALCPNGLRLIDSNVIE